MDIDSLKAFLAITETGSFTAAGHRVGRTQSAVSQQIKKLENVLGRPLFERGSGSVEMTHFGRQLLVHAREVLDAHDRTLEAFNLSPSGGGRVSLGMPEIYAEPLLSTLLPGFQALAPNVEISLTMTSSLALERMLRDGALDLAFVTDGEIEVPRGPVLFSERPIWLAAEDSKVEALDPLPLIVWGEGSNYRRTVLSSLEAIGKPYRVAMTTQSFGGMITAIKSGIGIGLATRLNVTGGIRALGASSGLPQLRMLKVHLERREGTAPPIVRRLEHFLIEKFGASDKLSSKSKGV